ncbi:zinc finger and BTB domain-containing protein 34-like isoform X1 [Vespula squamosa]|uniref:Zinc finger and BTB domain-containing protein 34-like isoform X1 n=1 Tax=Vespula squamosa TaxID=30214 RepID=A0ABD2ATP6_VESSQ
MIITLSKANGHGKVCVHCKQRGMVTSRGKLRQTRFKCWACNACLCRWPCFVDFHKIHRAGVTKGGTDVSPSCKHHRINTDLVVLDDDCGDVGGVGVGVGSRSTEAEFLFRCRICWKGFKHPMSLTLHKDLHAGQTKCPICQRIFSRSYDMKAHLMRIHANAKVDFRH